ncbi:putative USP domain-containing protein [Seiridium cardinale]
MKVDSDLRNEKNRDWADLQLQRSWPGGTEATKEWSGLNIMLIVLRHVFSFIPWDFRSSRLMQEAELKNPIFGLAWQAVAAEPEYLSAQAKIASLFATQGQPLPKFRDLLEHDIMISTLFSHPDFGLWEPQTWAIPPTASPRAWHRDHVFTAKEVAQKSIVRWDGKVDLPNCLEKKFGSYKDPLNQWVYLHLCNKPAFMFVAYEDDGSNGHDFADLQTLSINVEGWHVEPGVSPVLKTMAVKYTLIAAVRMSSGTNPRESVRLYALTGGSLVPPASASISKVTSTVWHIGRRADSYMLVYAKSTMPFRVPLNRTEETQAVAHESVDRQSANIDSLGDPALDWVQAPLVSEREGETDHDFADIDMLEAVSSSDSQESSASQAHAAVTQHSQAIENQALDQQPMASSPHSIIQSIEQEIPAQPPTGSPEAQEASSHRATLSTPVAPESIGQAKSVHQPTMAVARTTSQPSVDMALGVHPQRLQYIAPLTNESHSSEKLNLTLPKKPPMSGSSTASQQAPGPQIPFTFEAQQSRPSPQAPFTFEAQQAYPNPQIAQPQFGHAILFSSGNSTEEAEEDDQGDEQGQKHEEQHIAPHPFGSSSSHWQPSGQEQTYTYPFRFVTPQGPHGQVPLAQIHHTLAGPSGHLRGPAQPTPRTSQVNQGHPTTPYQTSDSYGYGYGYGQSSNPMANPFGFGQAPHDYGRRGRSRGGRGRRNPPRSEAATGSNRTSLGQRGGRGGRGGNKPFGV